ncbi:hypothetical protein X766_17745 [Mesorhizobium sp. LSJC255A00]|nr:hypothetical protein X766_17745 [Mesorhizobium sp. LSJC255A00]ESX40365.1 hypothetical protein X764_20750 [Mesorhizobium sp. LSHC440A00]
MNRRKRRIIEYDPVPIRECRECIRSTMVQSPVLVIDQIKQSLEERHRGKRIIEATFEVLPVAGMQIFDNEYPTI